MVGVNMTSLDANSVVQHLARVSPGLSKVADGDTVAMDKSFSGDLWDFVCLALYALGWMVGGVVLARKAYSIALGLKYTRYIMKGDVFMAFLNPSGHWLTVLINCLAISLGERYLYYRYDREPPKGKWAKEFRENFFESPQIEMDELTFRQEVALVTYGDDALRNSDKTISPDHGDRWLRDLGMHVTDGLKSATMEARPISDLSFLKRQLVLDPELGAYTARLSLKSMARTLMIKKESSLTLRDHAAVSISEVLRELVYYGPAMYESTRAILDSIADKHGLFHNSHFVSRPYAYWREQMMARTFASWTPDVQEPFYDGRWVKSPEGRFVWVSENPEMLSAK